MEFYNPLEPYTNACPLLPGQPVNVLDIPREFGSPPRGHKGRTSSSNIDPWTMDPDDKYLTPRPVPAPPCPSISRNGRRGYSASPPSLGRHSLFGSTTSLNKLLRKTSMGDIGEDQRSSSLVPPSFRSAFSHLRASRSVSLDSEGEHARRGSFGLGQKGYHAGWNISQPTLLTRTNSGRPCLPVGCAPSLVSSRDSSVSASARHNDAPGHQGSLSLEATEQRNEQAVAAKFSDSHSAFSSESGRPKDLSKHSHASASLPSGISPFRRIITSENSTPYDADQIVEETEEEDDDEFNFHRVSQIIEDQDSMKGLSPPPSRNMGVDDEEVLVDFPSFATRTTPTTDEQFRTSLPPFPTDLQQSNNQSDTRSPSPPRRAPPPLPDIEIVDKSHFSVWSDSSRVLSPFSESSSGSPSSPQSPSFSPLPSDSTTPLPIAAQTYPVLTSHDSTEKPVDYVTESSLQGYNSASTLSDGDLTSIVTNPTVALTQLSHTSPTAPVTGLRGYDLAEKHYSLEAMPCKPKNALESYHRKPPSRNTFGVDHQPISQWGEQITAMNDLVQDLQYLGSIIV